MNNDVDFDRAFDGFIDGRDYDEATSALFLVLRHAFLAGWLAAGGERPTGRNPVPFPGERITFPVLMDNEKISSK